jgi:MFS family permease
MLTATCFNAAGLLATRFFLGIAESGIAPGMSLIVSMWYTRGEQPLRQGAWFLGNTIAGLFGGLIGYGLGHVDSIASWKVCCRKQGLMSYNGAVTANKLMHVR